jgi:hypothetical protein
MDRRTPPQPQQERSGGGRDQVDVEQIMREIRGRIAQRQGIDLSNQQIQDLAARRLETILDPRAIKPSLLDALRRSAGAQAQRAAEKIPNEPAYSFEDTTIYDSHRGLMRFVRRLLNPLLKLFFNPNPLIRALHLQAKLNVEAAERDAERDRRQTEWNALHYEIVQRLVTEVSRASLELQALSLRIESLDAKVEFNERRVRGIEGSVHRARPQGREGQGQGQGQAQAQGQGQGQGQSQGQGRPAEPPAAAAPAVESESGPAEPAVPVAEGQPPSEGARRRRRRRRGRRSGVGTGTVPGDAAPLGGAPRPEPAPAALGAEPHAQGPRPIEHAPEPMEQAPDTGIYEAPPAPFEPPVAPVAFEPAPAPVQVEQAAAPVPIEEAPPPVPVGPPAPATEERAAPEPAGEPPDADRHEY